MKRIKILFLIFFLLTYCCPSITAGTIGGIYWVQRKLKLYPELIWLLAETKNYSTGDEDQYNNSWSKILINYRAVEFEKTLSSLACLDLILDGTKKSYKQFITRQNSNILTFSNFKILHKLLYSTFSKDITKDLLEKNLIIRDLGKSLTFRKIVEETYNIKERDPHSFIKKLLYTRNNLLPSYNSLSSKQKNILLYSDLFHFGHFMFLEGNPQILKPLIDNKNKIDKNILSFKFMTDIMEISGCMGHINNVGSVILNEIKFKTINYIINAVSRFKTLNAEDIFLDYINNKALELDLECKNNRDLVIVKIALLMNVTNIQDAKHLKESFSLLGINTQKNIIEEMHPLKNYTKYTPTYIPNVFLSYKNINKQKDSKYFIQNSVKLILPLIVKILKFYRQSINQELVLSFNIASKQISEGLKISSTTKFEIDNNGIVFLLN